jgi:2-oxo-4-hydroxy-4-carboxy-5-ureidoimidazoline decarboxylase
MNQTLAKWNRTSKEEALTAMLACCGATRWAEIMVRLRPIDTVVELSAAAGRIWAEMEEADWMEAIACHPRIGGREAAKASAKSIQWSGEEQAGAKSAEAEVLELLAQGNALYEERFGFTYVVCATGKSATEMLEILKKRLMRDRVIELKEAAEQQRLITQIRLGKWLSA